MGKILDLLTGTKAEDDGGDTSGEPSEEEITKKELAELRDKAKRLAVFERSEELEAELAKVKGELRDARSKNEKEREFDAMKKRVKELEKKLADMDDGGE